MKKFLFLLLISLSICSCSNDDDQINTSDLIGTWDWVSSSGGITGMTFTPETTGVSRQLEITSIVVRSIEDNVLLSETPYSIQVRETMSGESREMLIVGDGVGQIIRIEGNSLILTGDCSDCFTSEYIRQ